MKKTPASLKMRAIALLSQREHSPMELRRKLRRIQTDMARRAREALAGDASAKVTAGDAGDEFDGDELDGDRAAAKVDTLIVWLQARGYLSEQRFVESRIHARASRYGSLRIRQELAQHGLTLGEAARDELQASELERARAVWRRKFGDAPGDADTAPSREALRAQQARQVRFLTARGFSPDVVRRVLKSAASLDDDAALNEPLS